MLVHEAQQAAEAVERAGGSLRMSIAMCTYNGAGFLRHQLNSIAKQIVAPYELVVCDDGSSDETISILEEFSERSDFPVSIIRNEVNLRSSANFAKAMGLCRGHIVVLADQDDFWRSDKLLRICEQFNAAPELDLVFSDADLIDSVGEPLQQRLWDTIGFSVKLRRKVTQGGLFEVLMKQYVMTGATMAFRCEWRERILPIPPGWIHDAWIALTVAAMNGSIALLSEPLISYRLHDRQQIGVQRRTFWQQYHFGRSICPEDYETQSHQYHLAAQRLMELGGCCVQTFAQIEEKVTHLEARSRIRRLGFRGLAIAYREFVSGRYGRCSQGWKAFLMDIIIMIVGQRPLQNVNCRIAG